MQHLSPHTLPLPLQAKPRHRWHGMAWFGMACGLGNIHVVKLEAIFSKLVHKQCFKFGVHVSEVEY